MLRPFPPLDIGGRLTVRRAHLLKRGGAKLPPRTCRLSLPRPRGTRWYRRSNRRQAGATLPAVAASIAPFDSGAGSRWHSRVGTPRGRRDCLRGDLRLAAVSRRLRAPGWEALRARRSVGPEYTPRRLCPSPTTACGPRM